MKKLLFCLVFLLTSCANPINLQTASDYFNSGQQFIDQGKWFEARISLGRAWANINPGKASVRTKAIYAYEYGRASGVVCDWKESERGLIIALELDQLTDGPIYMSYVELARMYHAQGKYEDSEKYFSLAKAALDAQQADTKDSIGYANILEIYSHTLYKLGRKSEGDNIERRAQEIKNVFKDRQSHHGVTPYGQHCEQNPAEKS
jgi:tetratricopeptide (TPR) repeat protein